MSTIRRIFHEVVPMTDDIFEMYTPIENNTQIPVWGALLIRSPVHNVADFGYIVSGEFLYNQWPTKCKLMSPGDLANHLSCDSTEHEGSRSVLACFPTENASSVLAVYETWLDIQRHSS